MSDGGQLSGRGQAPAEAHRPVSRAAPTADLLALRAELARLQKQLATAEEQTRAAADLDRLKEECIATASHALKAPLATYAADEAHVQEPPEEQVVVQLVADGALAADRVEGDQQAGFQQPLGRDGRPAASRVRLIKDWRQLTQRTIGELLDDPQRMVAWQALFQIHERQHGRLRITSAAHSHHLRPGGSSVSAYPARPEGVRAMLRLVADVDLDGVTGRYFDGLQEARAHPQAYDVDARRRRREPSARRAGLPD